MASKTTIANLALNLIGQESITQFDEDSKNAEVARLVYDIVLHNMLMQHPWSFAIKRATLDTETLPAPTYGWDHRFALPEDCLKIVLVGQTFDDPTVDYQIEGRYILVNDTTVNIVYVSSDFNIQHADPAFVQAFAATLAMEMTVRVEGTGGMLNNMAALAQERMVQARQADGQQSDYHRDQTSWINERFSFPTSVGPRFRVW